MPHAALLIAVLLTGATPSPALASCLRPLPPEEAVAAAPVAFVGMVQQVAHEGRVADVLVESVWTGDGVTKHVVVDGRVSANNFTSVDRTFQVGARMLFLPQNATSPFSDNSCSSTTGFSPALAALRPPAARDPLPGGEVPAGAETLAEWVSRAIVVGLAAILLLMLGALLLRRRRRASI